MRINENLLLEIDGKKTNLKNTNDKEEFDGYIISWGETHHFSIARNGDKIWYLLSNNAKNNARIYYEKRFKIEKNYQDCKSSGYDIEKNKIRKYDRFKRMMYLVVLAHALTCIIGHVIGVTRNSIKKNSIAIDHLNTKLILALLELDTRPFLCTIKNPCISLDDSLRIN